MALHLRAMDAIHAVAPGTVYLIEVGRAFAQQSLGSSAVPGLTEAVLSVVCAQRSCDSAKYVTMTQCAVEVVVLHIGG